MEKKQTIQVKQDTKDTFEKARFKLKLKDKKLVTQDKFLEILLNTYRDKKWTINAVFARKNMKVMEIMLNLLWKDYVATTVILK